MCVCVCVCVYLYLFIYYKTKQYTSGNFIFVSNTVPPPHPLKHIIFFSSLCDRVIYVHQLLNCDSRNYIFLRNTPNPLKHTIFFLCVRVLFCFVFFSWKNHSSTPIPSVLFPLRNDTHTQAVPHQTLTIL